MSWIYSLISKDELKEVDIFTTTKRKKKKKIEKC